MLSTQLKASLDQSVLCWLATIDRDQQPNVSPKEIFTYYGEDRILIANIASPGSVRNINANPQVCLSFIDIFVQKGFKVKGQAQILEKAMSSFAEKVAPLQKMAGDNFPIASIIEIKIEAIDEIIAPSYRFYPETKEADQIASARKRYGYLD